MLLAIVVGISLAVVFIAVVVDAYAGYLSDRPKQEKTVVSEQEVIKGVKARRNLKKIEAGLNMLSQRDVHIDRPRGAHRRLQVS